MVWEPCTKEQWELNKNLWKIVKECWILSSLLEGVLGSETRMCLFHLSFQVSYYILNDLLYSSNWYEKWNKSSVFLLAIHWFVQMDSWNVNHSTAMISYALGSTNVEWKECDLAVVRPLMHAPSGAKLQIPWLAFSCSSVANHTKDDPTKPYRSESAICKLFTSEIKGISIFLCDLLLPKDCRILKCVSKISFLVGLYVSITASWFTIRLKGHKDERVSGPAATQMPRYP